MPKKPKAGKPPAKPAPKKPAKPKAQPRVKAAPILPAPAAVEPPRPGPKRPPDRMRAVEILVQQYKPASEIVRVITAKFDCCERTVYDDIKVVWATLQTADGEERDVRKHQMRSTLRRLYSKTVGALDFKAAVTVLDRLCKLDGLYEPEKHHHTGAVSEEQKQMLVAIGMTPVERAKRIAELEARAAGHGAAP
jgi:hypothetical protein